ncbi:hypothetical protein OIU34_00550 [Pararhizobium sp. BT-229]|uniref:hypothetical protein n=1 Tax=Pararhizobium sp. BT-229 TaxID=2986923 RepID=UPI0021F6CA09|nr:hypothetical protein [Pararhizobium sp. BT-229]MCV9960375.1 hypothetical protein [Pararhizobium sp. BT-229]
MWNVVTLTDGKASLVDFSKVLYIVGTDTGSTIYFQLKSENAAGKPAPKSINVTESLDQLSMVLKVERQADSR